MRGFLSLILNLIPGLAEDEFKVEKYANVHGYDAYPENADDGV